jgi:hypothetical protein
VPAFQLTAAGDIRPELRPLLTVLAYSGVGGWEARGWLTSRSSWLSGDVPAQIAVSGPQRALPDSGRRSRRPSGPL